MRLVTCVTLAVALDMGVCSTGVGAAEQAGAFRGENVELAVNYYAGGVGYSPQEAVAEKSPDYSVRVFFATPARSLLANVGLVVTDKQGRVVFRIERADPVIYLALPKGTYALEGSYRGLQRRYEEVVVDPRRRRDVVFEFPE